VRLFGTERSEAAMAWLRVEATLKGVLSILRWRGGELDRGESTRPRDTHGRASAPWLHSFTRAPAGLRRGLDDALLNICHKFCIGHFDQRSTMFK
jgi:hypothetical protein